MSEIDFVTKSCANYRSNIAPRPDRPFYEMEEKCFQSLYVSEYATAWDRIPIRTDGTCEWFLNHPEFLQWRDDIDSSLLWLSADPGCGKTVLSSFLYHYLNSPASSEPRMGRVIYFFFNADDAKQDSALAALSAMIHQLIAQDHNLITHVITEYEKKQDKFLGEFSTLIGIFSSIVAAKPDVNLLFVLDALDECREDSTSNSRTKLVENISHIVKFPRRRPIKIFITSRPLHTLQKRWTNSRTTLFDLGNVSSGIEDDIESFIKARLDVLDLEKTIRAGVESTLVNKADKTFLWVSLVLKDIESSPRLTKKTLTQRLAAIPSDLESLFEASLRQSRDKAATKKLLQILVFSKRPLSLTETDFAFNIDESDASTADVDREFQNIERTVRKLCGSLIRVTSNHLYLVHQTASEYLRSEKHQALQHSWKHSINALESNVLMTKACMTYLMFSDFESEIPVAVKSADPDRAFPFIHIEHREFEKGTIDQYPFLSYAASYWPEHFRESRIGKHEHLMDVSNTLCTTASARYRNWVTASELIDDLAPFIDPISFDPFVRVQLGHEAVVAEIIDSGYDIETKCDDDSLLSLAIRISHVEMVRVLVEKGADVEFKVDPVDEDTRPIHLVMERKDLRLEDRISMLRLLLQHGANINQSSDRYDNTELSSMIYRPHRPLFRKTGTTAIMTAAENGDMETVRFLMAQNADINIRNDAYDTALHLAVKGKHSEIVEQLFENSDPASSKLGMVFAASPTSYTVNFAPWDPISLKMMQFFLSSGLSANEKDYIGTTPIMYQFSAGHVKSVQTLSDTHPWPTSAKYSRRWPLDYEIDVEGMMQAMKQDPIPWNFIQELFKHTVDINSREASGRTVLHYATTVEGVGYLLDRGADPEAVDVDGKTPLMFAARWDNMDVVQCLIDRGADVNKADLRGDTTLHHASERNNEDTMAYLIGKGADKGVRNKAGRTALDNVTLYRPLLPGGTVYEAFEKAHAEYARSGGLQSASPGNQVSPLKRSLNRELKRRLALDKAEWESQVKNDSENKAEQDLEELVRRVTLESHPDINESDPYGLQGLSTRKIKYTLTRTDLERSQKDSESLSHIWESFLSHRKWLDVIRETHDSDEPL